ncbi:winged helix-turn-helix transcriptional regulator [Nocardia sp. CA-084685]|uniref:winged helix-turn-helix transcriptional regulator n=1 Tax=Nocardia sp. CA-084685 TaxID=3239970 RepID=UPI003D97997D
MSAHTRRSVDDQPDDLASLRELVSHRHVVEVLDALSSRPHVIAELATTIAGRRSALIPALRVLAAHGLITSASPGSWDRPPTDAIGLTSRGVDTVASLSYLAVWTALYEHTDHSCER